MMKVATKMTVVGLGPVGASVLYSSISQGLMLEYVLVDINVDMAAGQVLDLEDALALAAGPGIKISTGGYECLDDTDILVITAGRAQHGGETRLDLVMENSKIVCSIAEAVSRSRFSGIVIIVSNPVDVLATIFQKRAKMDPRRVIASSCALDTIRLKLALSRMFHVNPASLSLFALGEHGDTAVLTLAHATIEGIPITKEMYNKIGLDEQSIDSLCSAVRSKAYDIIRLKSTSCYGIGAIVASIVKSIIFDEKKVLAVGSLLSGEYGLSGIYMGIPSVVGRCGTEQTFEYPLSPDELERLQISFKAIKGAVDDVLIRSASTL